MSDAKIEADRLFRLMRSITFDKNDAKDCAAIAAQEMANCQQDLDGAEEYYEEVIEEIKKI